MEHLSAASRNCSLLYALAFGICGGCAYIYVALPSRTMKMKDAAILFVNVVALSALSGLWLGTVL